MKIIFSLIFAMLAALPCVRSNAQTAPYDSTSARILQIEEPFAIVVKREVIPGAIAFTRQNGCVLQIPVSTNFLDNGIIIKTPVQLKISGNTIPQWLNEYRKPWKSKLTDYEAGEYKIIFFQIGKHSSIPVRFEESDKQLLDAQTECAVAAYKIFGTNLKLLQLIPTQRQDSLSLPLIQGWERLFLN